MIAKRKRVFVALATLCAAGAVWATCGGTEALVSQSAGELASTAAGSIAEMAANVVALDAKQTNMLVSAIKTATKQVYLSGEKVVAASKGAELSSASFAAEMSNSELAQKIYVSYSSQGYNPCGLTEKTIAVAQAEKMSRANVQGRVLNEVKAPGGYADPAASVRAREELHKQLFCTQAEVDAGLCSSVGKIPGGDSNAALIFSIDKSDAAVKAKNAVINSIVGIPDAPLPAVSAKTPAADAYVLEKKRKDAYLSFAAYSLKSIQSDSEEVKPVLDERIGHYFGTPSAAKWVALQMGQAQRGLLVDLVKIQGLNLKLAERRLRQQLRTEGLLALLEAQENEVRNAPETRRAQHAAEAEMAQRMVK